MDKPTPGAKRLLDDLQSIHDLLDEPQMPPLLTDVVPNSSIPVLSDIVDDLAPKPSPLSEAARHLTMTQLAPELRLSAQLILQEVIDDFVPQIEAELRKRLEARLERLLPKG